jgi:hypothetical protein
MSAEVRSENARDEVLRQAQHERMRETKCFDRLSTNGHITQHERIHILSSDA